MGKEAVLDVVVEAFFPPPSASGSGGSPGDCVRACVRARAAEPRTFGEKGERGAYLWNTGE